MISIIIPTHNRSHDLKMCINNILKQKINEELELIIVDDGSTDQTKKIVMSLCKKHKHLKYLRQDNKGPAAARNLGAKIAKGDIICFTDDDCIPDKDWIKSVLRAHKKNRTVQVIGGLTRVDKNNRTGFITQHLTNSSIKQRFEEKERVIYFPTSNISLKKKVLEQFTFDEKFPFPGGEDLEFGWRLQKNKIKMLYDESIIVTHNLNPSLKSFLKRNYHYGIGNMLVKKMYPEHPLLLNINTKNKLLFYLTMAKGILETPFFGIFQLNKLTQKEKDISAIEKMIFFNYFCLHKLFYMFGNINEFQQNRNTVKKPDFLIIDCTHRCNLRCKMCDIVKDTKKELTTSEIIKVLEQGITWGVKHMVLSGGEPLIRADIFEILEFVKKRSSNVGILSNGTFDEKTFEKLKPYLINNNISLTISIDGVKATTHDYIRGQKGLYEKTMNTLKRLNALKEDYPNMNYGTISIIMNNNLEELEELARTMIGLKANSVQFQPLLANNLAMYKREESKFWIPNNRLKVLENTIKNLKNMKKEHPQIISNSQRELELVKKYFQNKLTANDVCCLAATKTMLVSNDGNITACKTAYGNIKNKLEHVWHSKKAEKTRILVLECEEPCLLPCFVEV
ncbi:MAG: glycosyltransferase [Nanoarchaeota archaeon]|nr:glycosyltransferase [Nanoarchaeota archaeon]MBU1604062.1 glycosyltransferase [Nanoarchaeota archaeon]